MAREFVPVSLEIHYAARRPDVEGRFLIERMKRPSFNGWVAVTPNGKILNEEPYLGIVLEKGLAEWKKLPEAERRPGIKLDDLGKPDPRLDLEPPAGGLILKVYIRSLERGTRGQLKVPLKIDLDNAGAAPIDAQAQRDHFWLTAAEAASMLPEAPKRGASYEAPAFFADRIFRHYLKDSATCIPGTSAVHFGGYTGTLSFTVSEATSSAVRLTLEGTARGNGPDFKILGRVDYDSARKAFSRFSLLAFSEAGHVDKKTKTAAPLGIAFELVPGDKAQDRIPPYFFTIDRWGGDPRAMVDAYFGSRK